jgi:hypothetical protein
VLESVVASAAFSNAHSRFARTVRRTRLYYTTDEEVLH